MPGQNGDLRAGPCPPQGRKNRDRYRATDGFRLPHEQQVTLSRHASPPQGIGAEDELATLFRIRPVTEGCVSARRLFQEIRACGYTQAAYPGRCTPQYLRALARLHVRV